MRDMRQYKCLKTHIIRRLFRCPFEGCVGYKKKIPREFQRGFFLLRRHGSLGYMLGDLGGKESRGSPVAGSEGRAEEGVRRNEG